MNILFLSLLDFSAFEERNIYCDLLREFMKNGHKVCCVSPVEKRRNQETDMLRFGENCILKLKIGNTQKTNLIEKGISTLRIESLLLQGIQDHFSDIKFDLVLYATPPVTFAKAIRFVKKRDGAKSYLLLKDIFPQNAVDLGMFSERSPLYWYFRAREKALYRLSDRIGCMSPANVNYVLKHNPEIDPSIVEICPNGIDPHEAEDRSDSKRALREKYDIPEGAVVYLYGGNLGKPQGIPFVIECLKANAGRADRYFIICGSGSEYGLLEEFIRVYHPSNVKLLAFLPREEYDLLAKGCDVGLVFLDHRFTIPNFPSRILSYMENGMPVMVCSDENTDLGEIAEKNGFGHWCISNDANQFTRCLDLFEGESIEAMGRKSREYLGENYLAQNCYDIIMNTNGINQKVR